MNIDEQNKELNRLRQYIAQIKNCHTSRTPEMNWAWDMDKDFAEYVNAVTELITQNGKSVIALGESTNSKFENLTERQRASLLEMAKKIRELDKETTRELFLPPERVKKELAILKKTIIKGVPDAELLEKYTYLFNKCLTKDENRVMTRVFLKGKITREVAKELKMKKTTALEAIRRGMEKVVELEDIFYGD